MQRHKLYLAVAAAVAVVALAISATAAGGSAKSTNGEGSGHSQLISESALLAGMASNSLFPFLDTTPNTIRRTHIAITDATAACSAGAAPPANIHVLVGQAGVALTNVMTAATNTGIGTAAQCVFHVTARPREGGVPRTVTDVVVRNAGAAPLTGINTVTASATVRTSR
jgi:hypothetical protein